MEVEGIMISGGRRGKQYNQEEQVNREGGDWERREKRESEDQFREEKVKCCIKVRG